MREPPRCEARHDDHDKPRERDERDAVVQQAAARERPWAAADDAGRLARVADGNDLRHPWSPGPHSLLDPQLAHEHVELSAPDVVAHALRNEVDQARIEEHGLRRVVGRQAVDLGPELERRLRVVMPRLSAFCILASTALLQ